jgi:coenzyme F420-reducing hydrogenase alpha subunit
MAIDFYDSKSQNPNQSHINFSIYTDLIQLIVYEYSYHKRFHLDQEILQMAIDFYDSKSQNPNQSHINFSIYTDLIQLIVIEYSYHKRFHLD